MFTFLYHNFCWLHLYSLEDLIKGSPFSLRNNSNKRDKDKPPTLRINKSENKQPEACPVNMIKKLPC